MAAQIVSPRVVLSSTELVSYEFLPNSDLFSEHVDVEVIASASSKELGMKHHVLLPPCVVHLPRWLLLTFLTVKGKRMVGINISYK
jgi:hypothetical protein